MAIEKDLLDQLLAGRDPKDVFNKDGLVDELRKALSERILNADRLAAPIPRRHREHHHATAFVAMFADQFIWHDWTTPQPIRDKQAAGQYFNGWMTAIPDMKTKVVSRVVGDDSVAVEIEFAGTNSGPMNMGGKTMPATNKKVVGRGTYFVRFGGGKIVEYRTHPDVAGLMMQLGMMPGM